MIQDVNIYVSHVFLFSALSATIKLISIQGRFRGIWQILYIVVRAFVFNYVKPLITTELNMIQILEWIMEFLKFRINVYKSSEFL